MPRFPVRSLTLALLPGAAAPALAQSKVAPDSNGSDAATIDPPVPAGRLNALQAKVEALDERLDRLKPLAPVGANTRGSAIATRLHLDW